MHILFLERGVVVVSFLLYYGVTPKQGAHSVLPIVLIVYFSILLNVTKQRLKLPMLDGKVDKRLSGDLDILPCSVYCPLHVPSPAAKPVNLTVNKVTQVKGQYEPGVVETSDALVGKEAPFSKAGLGFVGKSEVGVEDGSESVEFVEVSGYGFKVGEALLREESEVGVELHLFLLWVVVVEVE